MPTQIRSVRAVSLSHSTGGAMGRLGGVPHLLCEHIPDGHQLGEQDQLGSLGGGVLHERLRPLETGQDALGSRGLNRRNPHRRRAMGQVRRRRLAPNGVRPIHRTAYEPRARSREPAYSPRPIDRQRSIA